jgi:hypothetical protein
MSLRVTGGIAGHWQQSNTWSDMQAALAWMRRATVAARHNGTAVQGLW